MSDFDKIFAERLNEEEPFPRQEKSWRSLSKRLDAYDAGLGGSSRYLRYWQAAAAVLLLGVSLLFGKVWTMHEELGVLRKEVADLHRRLPAMGDTHANPAPVAQVPLTEQPGPSGTNQTGAPAQALTSVATPENLPSIRQPEPGNARPAKTNTPGRNGAGAAALGHAQVEKSIVESPSNPTQLLIDQIPTKNNAVAANPANEQTPQQQHAPIEQPRQNTREMDMLAPLPTTGLAIVLTGPEKKRLALAAVPAYMRQSPVIRPVPPQVGRFRAGLQATVGIPGTKNNGISAQKGVGVSAEMTLWRDLRLSASADWMRHEVKSDVYPEHCHFPPKDSMKLPPNKEFVRVEGSQRSQQYSLGLSYTLPVHFWVRPAVRFAHSWVHLPADLYTFQYAENDPQHPGGHHDPFFFPKRSEAAWLKNNWRLGFGLEHESPVWTIGVWADYSKNLKAKESLFDALYVRAGVQYRFD